MAHAEALRVRVIKAVVEDGLSRNAAARIFRVGIASAIRWVNSFQQTNRTAALPVGGDRRSVLKPHRDWLLDLRRKENDLTLDAIADRLLQAHGQGRQIDAVALLRGRADQLQKKPYAPASRIAPTSLSDGKRGGTRKAAWAAG